MIKSDKGSVTMAAFAALLLFTMYGIIIYSNSARSYIIQNKTLKNIKSSYMDSLDLEQLYESMGGVTVDYTL